PFVPAISDSGYYEFGDVESYLRQRAATPGDPTGSAFDRMSPEDQRRYIAENWPLYQAQRQAEAYERSGQVIGGRWGGFVGDVGAAVAGGALAAGGGQGRGVRAPREAPGANAPRERSCLTCHPNAGGSATETRIVRTGNHRLAAILH